MMTQFLADLVARRRQIVEMLSKARGNGRSAPRSNV